MLRWYRARFHHDVSMRQQAVPVPAHLEARVAGGRELPSVEVVPVEPPKQARVARGMRQGGVARERQRV
jgi:hypothetical protein